jgi:GNAT superfamily N-acetyltransferase
MGISIPNTSSPHNILNTMPVDKQYIPISMIRPHLEDIPVHVLPAGHYLRMYRPGDEPVWVEIQALADHYNTITTELFAREFGQDWAVLAERQLYLCDATNTAIGTATAWFDDNYRGKRYGRIHWVAILPDKQGYGLAKPLMTTACHMLRDLGHSRAYLTTSTARIPAINLYLQFGFIPQIDTPGDSEVWYMLQKQLKRSKN